MSLYRRIKTTLREDLMYPTFDPDISFRLRRRRRNLTPFKQTDGGRMYGERRDCTVRAMAIAANISYADAHALLALEGRKPKSGANGPQIEHALKSLCTMFEDIKVTKLKLVNYQVNDQGGLFNAEELERPERQRYTIRGGDQRWRPVTLKLLLMRLGKGRYYVTSRAHAFAIIDGVVHDAWQVGSHMRILSIWRIEKEGL